MKRTALVLMAFALSACSHSVPAPAASTPGGTVVALGDGLALAVEGTASTADSTNPSCAASLLSLHTSSGDFETYLLRPGCVATDGTPENGDHGFYPTAPARARTEQVATPVGTATLFSNQYAECTSSCYLGTDEVALVPVAGQVVQVVAVTSPASGTTTRDRTALVAVLQGLRHA